MKSDQIYRSRRQVLHPPHHNASTREAHEQHRVSFTCTKLAHLEPSLQAAWCSQSSGGALAVAGLVGANERAPRWWRQLAGFRAATGKECTQERCERSWCAQKKVAKLT